MSKIFKSILAFALCLLLCLPVLSSVSGLVAFADGESSADDEESVTVDIWETKGPAYMSVSFSSVKSRILGNTSLDRLELYLEPTEAIPYALYVDKLTGEVIVLRCNDPVDGKFEKSGDDIYLYQSYWCSNPYNAGASTSPSKNASTDSIKQQLYSQLIIKYVDKSSSNTENEMNSYKDSAKNNQITVKKIANGIRVEYKLGRAENTYMVPRVIKLEKFQALLEQIRTNCTETRPANRFESFYTIKDVNDPNISDKSKEEYKKKYPICEQFPIAVCEPAISVQELKTLEGWLKMYTDYSLEQLQIDHDEVEYVNKDEAPAQFKLALEYKLDGDGLSIRCNMGNVRFDSSTYSLKNIIILPYAGTGNVVNNEGFVFSADGSGTVINFSDIIGTQFKNTNKVYGQDYAYREISGSNKQAVRLPVFGIVETKNNSYTEKIVSTELDEDGNEVKVETTKYIKNGYFAVVEEGESLVNLTIENGGATHMFVSCYGTINPRPSDNISLDAGLSAGSASTWTVECERKYTKDYKVRVFLLNDEESSVSGMANIYRNYLINKGVLTAIDEEKTAEDIPLYIETLCALETSSSVLGIPVLKMMSLSSFDKIIEMLELLGDKADISNVKLRLMGWQDGGIGYTVPNGVDVEDVIGGEEGLKKLIEYASKSGATVYPDFDFVYAHHDKWFDGFSQSKDLAKTINDRYARHQYYDALYQGYGTSGMGIISASVMDRFYTNSWEEYKEYNAGAISVGALGEALSSDFDEDEPYNREDTKILTTKLLEKIKNDNGNVMVSGGNAYAFPYVTDIVNIALDDSGYQYSATSVPFTGMVLHGYIEYAGEPINLAGDYRYTVLKTIENGANPYFVFAIENTSELKKYNSWYEVSGYYSVRYNIWLNDMVATYNELNAALADVKTASIVNHEFLDDEYDVVKVTYSNGVSYIINYKLTSVTVDVDGTEYTVEGENFIKLDANGKKSK
ncbi:MAG: hypothetical protein J6A85_08150 [Clostridia bacterium]|nr:hypothetical protein [Clostridia bacterium]